VVEVVAVVAVAAGVVEAMVVAGVDEEADEAIDNSLTAQIYKMVPNDCPQAHMSTTKAHGSSATSGNLKYQLIERGTSATCRRTKMQ
jgi:hypothetical protein